MAGFNFRATRHNREIYSSAIKQLGCYESRLDSLTRLPYKTRCSYIFNRHSDGLEEYSMIAWNPYIGMICQYLSNLRLYFCSRKQDISRFPFNARSALGNHITR